MDAKFFDDWAKDYEADVIASDAAGLYPFAGYRRVVEHIISIIAGKTGARVLDLGFGTGFLSKKLYDAGYEISGVDFSPEMCGIAKKMMPKADLICHDFAQGLPLELDDKKFDFIISTYAFHHVPDADKSRRIREWYAMLTQDGSIIIGDVAFETQENLEKCRSECGDYWDDEESYTVFTELLPEIIDLKPIFKVFSHCAGVLRIN